MSNANPPDFAAAIVQLDALIASNPHNAIAYTRRAQLNLLLGQTGAALEDIDRAIALDDSIPGPYSMRGMLYFQAGRYLDALADVNRTIELEPASARYYLRRADIYSQLSLPLYARADIERVLEIDPAADNSLPAQGYILRAYAYIALDRFAEAEADLEYARAHDANEREYAAASAELGKARQGLLLA